MGTSNDGFSLKWDAYQSHAAGAFADLRFDSVLSDITLVCDGENFRAHRVILSTSSLVFKQLFASTKLTHPAANPLVMLWDIEADILTSLLDFMYLGEVSVANDRFNDFMIAAERLQILGLSQYGGKRGNTPLFPDFPSSHKRVRLQSPEIEERNTRSLLDLPDGEQLDSTDLDLDLDDRHDLDEDSLLAAQNEEYQRAMRHVATEPPTIGPNGIKEYCCIFCDKKYLRRSRVRRHISDTHITGFFPCSECGKVFASNRKMKDHQSKSKCRNGLDTSESFPELRDQHIDQDNPMESLDSTISTEVIVTQILNEQN